MVNGANATEEVPRTSQQIVITERRGLSSGDYIAWIPKHVCFSPEENIDVLKKASRVFLNDLLVN